MNRKKFDYPCLHVLVEGFEFDNRKFSEALYEYADEANITGSFKINNSFNTQMFLIGEIENIYLKMIDPLSSEHCVNSIKIERINNSRPEKEFIEIFD